MRAHLCPPGKDHEAAIKHPKRKGEHRSAEIYFNWDMTHSHKMEANLITDSIFWARQPARPYFLRRNASDTQLLIPSSRASGVPLWVASCLTV